MITLRFFDPSLLPDRRITADGPVSRAFLERGITDLRHAARHVRDTPYAKSTDPNDPLSLLREGHGTCIAKHNAIAELARENGIPVYRLEGVYWLNDDIVPDVSRVLAPHGLREIPRAHCFLECGGRFFDLTEGNCTGKRGPITAYLRIGRVGIGQDNTILKTFLADWRQIDDTLEHMDDSQFFQLLDECATHNHNLCQVPHTPATGVAAAATAAKSPLPLTTPKPTGRGDRCGITT
jgi:hypothetical protein